jgi:hypothetical protein
MSRKIPVIGPEELKSHAGEGVHAGLRKGGDAPSSGPLWTAIADSEDSAWGDAIAFFVYGLKMMYPNGFTYDPDKPEGAPQHVMDADSVVWVWNSKIRKVRGRWSGGAYVPRDSKRLPEELKGAPMTLDMLRNERGPVVSIEIEGEV